MQELSASRYRRDVCLRRVLVSCYLYTWSETNVTKILVNGFISLDTTRSTTRDCVVVARPGTILNCSMSELCHVCMYYNLSRTTAWGMMKLF